MPDHDLLNVRLAGLSLPNLARHDQLRETSRSSSQPSAVDRVACRVGDASCGDAHAATLSRSMRLDRSSVESSMLKLQRDFGNHYVGQVIDRVRDDDGGNEAVIERTIDGARGGGQGLDHAVRGQMESSFGADFGAVRVHTDDRADHLSSALSAKAFTTGPDIFFRHGEYSPGSSGGRELLAHELTHVVQQNGDGIQRKMTVSQPGDTHEIEADQMARLVMQHEQHGGANSNPAAVQRQPEKLPEEEDKKKLQMKAEASTVALQPEEEEPQQG